MTRAHRCLLLAILSFLALPSFAQVRTGTPPFSSIGGGPDAINLASLNSHILAPVIHKGGRGMPFTYDLSYDSSVLFPSSITGTNAWTPASNWGWRGQTEVAVGYLSFATSSIFCGDSSGHRGGVEIIRSNWSYNDNFGVSHLFAGQTLQASGTCGNMTTSFQATATDGSGYTLNATGSSGTVTSAAGAVINPPVGVTVGSGIATDRNGNKISVNTSGVFTDTLGTTALTVAGGAPNPLTFTYTAPSGASATVSLSYVTYTVKTNFGCSGVAEYGPTSTPLVDRMTLPDGSFYQFTYEPTPGFSGDVTGRLASITLPTGGTISYQYTGGNNGIICADGSAAGLTRTTPDGVWTYARSIGSGAASTTAITDPQGNQTVLQFQGIYETQRQVFQGSSTSGTLLRKWNTCYNFAAAPCTATAITLPITARVVTDQYGSSGPQCKHIYSYDGFGNLTEQDDYDYGPSGPGPLLKTTSITMASLGSSLHAFVQTVTVQEASGTVKFRQDVTYDQAANENTPCITGAPQHDDSGHGCTFTGRGNRTSVTTYTDPVGATGPITTTMTYDSLGNLRTTTDALSHTTTFGYTDAWSTTTCTPPSGTNAFVTSVSNTLSQAASAKYDPCTGMIASITDPNSQTTSFAYDSMWRSSQTSLPDGGQTSFSYNTTSLPASVTATTKMNSTQNIIGTTVFDGLGRDKQDQLNSDPLGVTYVDTTYDGLGRVASVSNPHRSASLPTDGITTYQYDALSRATKVIPPDGSTSANNVITAFANNCATVTDQAGKLRKTCYDSLGRLTQAFEPDASNSLVNETDYQYDALGNLLCAVQRGTDTTAFTNCASAPASWRPRSFVYDGLSRLTSATNPESGTVTYGYDAASNLQTRTAPAPNQTGGATVITTYSYDALNRLTLKSFSDGTTPQANFMYDRGPAWTGPFTNMLGRLGEAWTGNITAVSVFSYDAMGRVIMNLQGTPNEPSTNFPVNYTYDLAGNMLSGTNGVGITISNQYDSAGRVTQITSSLVDAQHPATLLTTDASVGYYPHGALRKAALGNGLTATNVYNSRLQPCLLDVNSSNVTLQTCNDSTPGGNVLDFWMGYNAGTSNNGNVVNWNATGVQSFIRTYTYDTVNRLATMADSASTQPCKGLSWTYDIWGNRTDQNVTSGSCNASHVSVNAQNRLSGAPYQYDTAGNLINDGNHSYTYDAENRLISVDGGSTASYTYDALGRRVEKVTPSRTNDYVYDLNGNAVTEYCSVPGFTGWCTGYIYFNGQLAAQYSNSTTYFAHKDHLGSTRLLTVAGASTRIQSSGGTSTLKYYSNGVCPSVSGTTYTLAVWVRNQGTAPVKIYGNIVDGPTIAPGTGQLVLFTETGNGFNCAQLGFATLNVGDPIDVLAYNPLLLGPGGNLIPPANQNFSGWNTYLGSSVTVTQGQPALAFESMDYLPFGEQIAGASATTHKFTSDERDSETSLDHTWFRQYSSSLGRWTTPDPFAGYIDDPQSLNRYSYVLNNPMNLTDPLGLRCIWDDGSFDSPDDPKTGTQSGCEGQGGTWMDETGGNACRACGSLDWTDTGNDGLAFWVWAQQNPDSIIRTTTAECISCRNTSDIDWNWWGTFASNFFTFAGGPGNVPTCAGSALRHIAGEFIPFVPSESSAIQATGPLAQAWAFNNTVAQTEAGIDAYIAGRGLTVPLRSGVVRAMVAQGAKNAVATGAKANFAVQTFAVDYAAVKSTYITSGEARSGACAAAFPIF